MCADPRRSRGTQGRRGILVVFAQAGKTDSSGILTAQRETREIEVAWPRSTRSRVAGSSPDPPPAISRATGAETGILRPGGNEGIANDQATGIGPNHLVTRTSSGTSKLK